MVQCLLIVVGVCGLVCFIVVNKIDCLDVDLFGLLVQICEVFGKECLFFNLLVDGVWCVVDCFFMVFGDVDFLFVVEVYCVLVEQVVEVDVVFVDCYLNDGDVDF